VVKKTTELVTLAHFSDARRVDVEQMRKWVGFALSRECRVIVLDHIHRMSFGPDAKNLTHDMAEAVRTAKELAVKHSITMILAAQLNRPDRDAALLGDYMPPPVSAFKQTGALEEEADVALLLHKALKRGASAADVRGVRQGQRPMVDVVEQNVMAIRVGKHRLDGGAVDHTEWLVVDHIGRLTERAASWQTQAVEERYGV